jgi:hypothetical protein
MQYILMLHAAESGWAQLTEAQQREGMAAYHAYTEALQKAGVLRGVNRLRPSTTATLVRAVEGKSQVLNGPYVDAREQMGGSTSSMCPIRKRRWRGRGGVRQPITGRSRCARCGRKRPESAEKYFFWPHVEIGGMPSVMRVKQEVGGDGAAEFTTET